MTTATITIEYGDNTFDIKPTGRDVGGNDTLGPALGEVLERLLALPLILIAVYGLGPDPCSVDALGDVTVPPRNPWVKPEVSHQARKQRSPIPESNQTLKGGEERKACSHEHR